MAALNLEGIGFVKESHREYPNNELAAHVLGFVGIDSKGLNGLESAYDSQIRGKDRPGARPDRRATAAPSTGSSVRRPPARRSS